MGLRPQSGQYSGNGKSTYNREQFSWDIFTPEKDKFSRIPSLSVVSLNSFLYTEYI